MRYGRAPEVRRIRSTSHVVTAAPVDYTIVRLTRPVDKPATGVVKSGYLGRDKIGWSIRRSDMAAFIVSQLTDTRYIRAMPVISN
jgi:NAD(P)H-binding